MTPPIADLCERLRKRGMIVGYDTERAYATALWGADPLCQQAATALEALSVRVGELEEEISQLLDEKMEALDQMKIIKEKVECLADQSRRMRPRVHG